MTEVAAAGRSAPPPHRPWWASALAVLLAVVVVLVVGSVVSGVLSGLSTRSTSGAQEHSGVRRVVVEGGTIDLVLRERAGTDARPGLVTTRWSLTSAGRQFTVTDRLSSDGVLTVTTECAGPLVWRGGCQTRIELGIPPGMPVTAALTFGAVQGDGLSGPLEVALQAGAVQLGTLRSTRAIAAVGAGRIQLDFVGHPDTVNATATIGAVTVNLPPGSTGYAVQVASALGSTRRTLPDDPVAERQIVAATSLGDAEVTAGPPLEPFIDDTGAPSRPATAG